MDEDKQEKISIIRLFLVALLIVIAVFLFGYVIDAGFNNIIVISVITFEIFIINGIYSNHIMKQITKLQVSMVDLKEAISKLKK